MEYLIVKSHLWTTLSANLKYTLLSIQVLTTCFRILHKNLCLPQCNFESFVKYCSILWCFKQACFLKVASLQVVVRLVKHMILVVMFCKQEEVTVHDGGRQHQHIWCSSINTPNEKKRSRKITKWMFYHEMLPHLFLPRIHYAKT